MFDVDFELLTNAEAQDFYVAHKHENIQKLLLKYSSNALFKARVIQMDARLRAAKKIPDWYNNAQILFPPKAFLQQSSSQITATYKANIFKTHTSLDLTGGTGIDTWQLAKQSQAHLYVEQNTHLVALAKHNFKALKISNIKIINVEASEFLLTTSQTFDLIYIDPARTISGSKRINLAQYEPNVLQLLPVLLKKGNNVLVKVSPMADIAYLIDALKHSVFELHVVAVADDCKEILLCLRDGFFENPRIKTINFLTTSQQRFDFFLANEREMAPIASSIEKYIYQPNVAVRSAGAFNSVAKAFNLKKLDRNTQLYTASHFCSNFPGAIYNVIETAAPFKLKGTYQRVSISTKNYNLTPENIRKRSGYSDGNDFKLFGTTLAGKPLFIMSMMVE